MQTLEEQSTTNQVTGTAQQEKSAEEAKEDSEVDDSEEKDGKQLRLLSWLTQNSEEATQTKSSIKLVPIFNKIASKVNQNLSKNHPKSVPKALLGALGRVLGAILAPRWPKTPPKSDRRKLRKGSWVPKSSQNPAKIEPRSI